MVAKLEAVTRHTLSPITTFTSDALTLKPLPERVICVPELPMTGVTEVTDGVTEGENVKEHNRFEQVDGVLFTSTVT